VRPDLPALTGLRFLAAAHVVIGHIAVTMISPTGWGHAIASTGYIGVTLFFLLSGFILAYNYAGQDGELRGTRRTFWVARLARVYPLYLFALLLAAASFAFSFVTHRIGTVAAAQAGVLTPFLLQAWHPDSHVALAWNMPGWSLSAEAFFYLVFPGMLMVLSKIQPRYFLLTSIGLWAGALLPAVCQATAFPDLNWQEYVIHLPLLRLAEFSLGVVLGLMYLRGIRLNGQWALPLLLGVGAALIVVYGQVPKSVISNGLFSPLFGLLVIALAAGGGWLPTILGTPLARLLGEASYGIYLLHIPLYGWYRLALDRLIPGFAEGLPGFGVFFVILTVCSIYAYRYVEVPGRHWLRRRLQPGPRTRAR
jgi:peptidoglycan/LPS O-acetylase OafA/YrhL